MNFEVKLVFLQRIRQHPVLYDPRDQNFRNTRGEEKDVAFGIIMEQLNHEFEGENLNLTVPMLKQEWETTKNRYRSQVQQGMAVHNPFHEYLHWYIPYINILKLHPLEAQDRILGLTDLNEELVQRVANLERERDDLQRQVQHQQLAKQQVVEQILNVLLP